MLKGKARAKSLGSGDVDEISSFKSVAAEVDQSRRLAPGEYSVGLIRSLGG